jgi:hypothetical protein
MTATVLATDFIPARDRQSAIRPVGASKAWCYVLETRRTCRGNRHHHVHSGRVGHRETGPALLIQWPSVMLAFQRGGFAELARYDVARLVEADRTGRAPAAYFSRLAIAGTFARQYAVIGDREQALAWLEEAARRREPRTGCRFETTPGFNRSNGWSAYRCVPITRKLRASRSL